MIIQIDTSKLPEHLESALIDQLKKMKIELVDMVHKKIDENGRLVKWYTVNGGDAIYFND
jgi:hypothetical protein